VEENLKKPQRLIDRPQDAAHLPRDSVAAEYRAAIFCILPEPHEQTIYRDEDSDSVKEGLVRQQVPSVLDGGDDMAGGDGLEPRDRVAVRPPFRRMI
jgi:hypothetical protein